MTQRPWSARTLTAVFACAAGTIGVAATLGRLLRGRYYRVEVAGRSMHPALQPGDYVIVRRGAPPTGDAAFGHVAALADPTGRLLLKRIVGLPGEALRVGTVVQVNGRVLVERYAHGTTPVTQFRGLNRLDDDEYFLLGDRRDASTDSRDFGGVRRDRIEGVAVARYWPPKRIGRLARPRRELAGAAPADTGVPDGIVGAGRVLTARPPRTPIGAPIAQPSATPDGGDAEGAEGGGSGES